MSSCVTSKVNRSVAGAKDAHKFLSACQLHYSRGSCMDKYHRSKKVILSYSLTHWIEFLDCIKEDCDNAQSSGNFDDCFNDCKDYIKNCNKFFSFLRC